MDSVAASTVVFVGTSVAMVVYLRRCRRTVRAVVRYGSSRRGADDAAATATATAPCHSPSKKPSASLPYPSLDKAQVLALRRAHSARALSLSYANTDPLLVVAGHGARLVDERGRSYLDTRNNVAHCGHGHPRVVAAVQAQVAAVNTNTRYLHPAPALLAQRLASSLPDPLEVVFFCNSGSEANDLALRLARAYSGSRNTIVLAGAYHGHTLAALEASPYKYGGGAEHPGLARHHPACPLPSPGPHIWPVPCPDTYRGECRDPRMAGAQYAAHVEAACRAYREDRGERVGAFLVEGGLSVAGVLLPPPGYLAAGARAVRAAGGLVIADEVQTGFGRLGATYWAFQHGDSGFVPDVVTVGKPFGNGMPLAAVVTSRAVADRFDALGVELFNTFGGNPVCAAAGLAVLDVIDAEHLQERALEVGTYLKERFWDLSNRVELLGDVRGSGLFLGIELVRDRRTLDPAASETSFICSILKSQFRILTSIDGPHENVIVVKPPMVFSLEDADYFVNSFESAARLCNDENLDLSGQGRTPT